VNLYFLKDIPLKEVIVRQEELFRMNNAFIQIFFFTAIFCVVVSIGYLLHRYVTTFKNANCVAVAEFTRLSAIATLPKKALERISKAELKSLILESPHQKNSTTVEMMKEKNLDDFEKALERFKTLLKIDP